jgi:hypothetical protein
MFDSTDPMACIRYRIAYGEASRLIEMSRYDHAWGRDFVARVDRRAEAILAEVIRRIGDRSLEVVRGGRGCAGGTAAEVVTRESNTATNDMRTIVGTPEARAGDGSASTTTRHSSYLDRRSLPRGRLPLEAPGLITIGTRQISSHRKKS